MSRRAASGGGRAIPLQIDHQGPPSQGAVEGGRIGTVCALRHIPGKGLFARALIDGPGFLALAQELARRRGESVTGLLSFLFQSKASCWKFCWTSREAAPRKKAPKTSRAVNRAGSARWRAKTFGGGGAVKITTRTMTMATMITTTTTAAASAATTTTTTMTTTKKRTTGPSVGGEMHEAERDASCPNCWTLRPC